MIPSTSHSQKKGFTLLELMLSIAFAGILIAAITQWFAATVQTQAKIDSMEQVNYYGAKIMHDILQSIRNAQSISTPSQGATASSISIIVDTGSKSPTLFDVSSSIIRMTEGVQAPQLLHPNWIVASNFSATNLSYASTPGTVRVQFTLSRKNPSNIPSFSYQQTFYGSANVRQ